MEIAKCLVALGGDLNNVVPKTDVTPAEVLTLIAVHGEGAVTDIEVTGEIERTNRQELERLRDVLTGYGRAQDNDAKPVIHSVFPGAGARVPDTFAETELPEGLYKVLPKVKKAKQPANVLA